MDYHVFAIFIIMATSFAFGYFLGKFNNFRG